MLFMAMFVTNRQWLQLQIFIALNFLSFAYVVVISPFSTAYVNNLNIFNEGIGMLAAYFLLPLQDKGFNPEELYTIAELPVQIFNASALINCSVILVISAINFYQWVKQLYRRFCRKKT